MDDPEQAAEMEWIDMGTLKSFLRRIERVQKRFNDREYRFIQSMDDFWLFEEEDDDEIQGAILFVQKERVYAISKDVFKLVDESLARSK